MPMDYETLYLRLFDEMKKREAMDTRLKRLEDFIQSKYAGELSPAFEGDHGELGTDPTLNPVVIDFNAPLVGELPQPSTGPAPLEAENVQQGK